MESEPPTSRTRSALINPPHYGSNMPWPQDKLPLHPHPSDTLSTQHPPSTGETSVCAPPPRIISGTALKSCRSLLHSVWRNTSAPETHQGHQCHGEERDLGRRLPDGKFFMPDVGVKNATTVGRSNPPGGTSLSPVQNFRSCGRAYLKCENERKGGVKCKKETYYIAYRPG